MNKIQVAGVALLALMFGAYCQGRSAGERPHEDAEAAHAESGGDASVEHHDASATPVVSLDGVRGIRVIPVPPRRQEGAWFPGEAVSDEGSSAILSSPVSGIVAPSFVPPGVPIRRGTPLLTIRSPEAAELAVRLRVAEAELTRARSELAREQQLAAVRATSQRELESAVSVEAAAQAQRDAARIGLDARGLDAADASGKYVVAAPADGSVVSWNVLAGQGIAAGERLGSFQSGSARLVRVDLTPPGPEWRIGDSTSVRTSDGRQFDARVVGVPAVLGADTRRLGYRLALAGAVLPLPGNPVEVRVPFPVSVILPQTALQQIEGRWGVFVRAGSVAEFRPVRRGVELGTDVTVLEGVEPGQEVVAEGAYLLKASWMKSRSGGDEHEH